MFFGGINNVNGKLNIILAAMQNFKRFLGMKPLPPGAFVLPSVIPVDPYLHIESRLQAIDSLQTLSNCQSLKYLVRVLRDCLRGGVDTKYSRESINSDFY